VDLVNSRWFEFGVPSGALLAQADVQTLQVLRLKAINPVRTNTRYQVVVDGDAVAGERVGAHRWRGDGFHPVGKPLLDGPRTPSSPDFTAFPLPFQLTDGGDDFGLGLALDVPAVWSAIVANADGDASVPLAVFAEVDSACAVGSAASRLAFACHFTRRSVR
jgi:hypothetical protein